MKIPELNVTSMQNLYHFGGLLVYRVAYFDPLGFKVQHRQATFSEEHAKRQLQELEKAGFTAGIESFIAKFDGAFSL